MFVFIMVLGIIQALILLKIFTLILKLEGKRISSLLPKEIFHREVKETAEEKRMRIISENIDNYNGSGKGQIKL